MQKAFEFSQQVAVVTGGFGQLGQRISVLLAQAGAQVVVLDSVSQPKKIDSEFSHFFENGKIKNFVVDLRNRSQIADVADRIDTSIGVPTVLINNAALDSPPSSGASENGPFEEYPQSSLDAVIDVNLKGVIYCCQIFGKKMAERKKGSIVNVASIYGMVSPNQDIYEYKRTDGTQWFKPVAYSVTKSALYGLTKYLATYWAKRGVRINSISPAGIFNHQDEQFLSEYLRRMPMGRMAEVDEIAQSVGFLASDLSSYVTGTNLVVDGGWTAW